MGQQLSFHDEDDKENDPIITTAAATPASEVQNNSSSSSSRQPSTLSGAGGAMNVVGSSTLACGGGATPGYYSNITLRRYKPSANMRAHLGLTTSPPITPPTTERGEVELDSGEGKALVSSINTHTTYDQCANKNNATTYLALSTPPSSLGNPKNNNATPQTSATSAVASEGNVSSGNVKPISGFQHPGIYANNRINFDRTTNSVLSLNSDQNSESDPTRLTSISSPTYAMTPRLEIRSPLSDVQGRERVTSEFEESAVSRRTRSRSRSTMQPASPTVKTAVIDVTGLSTSGKFCRHFPIGGMSPPQDTTQDGDGDTPSPQFESSSPPDLDNPTPLSGSRRRLKVPARLQRQRSISLPDATADDSSRNHPHKTSTRAKKQQPREQYSRVVPPQLRPVVFTSAFPENGLPEMLQKTDNKFSNDGAGGRSFVSSNRSRTQSLSMISSSFMVQNGRGAPYLARMSQIPLDGSLGIGGGVGGLAGYSGMSFVSDSTVGGAADAGDNNNCDTTSVCGKGRHRQNSLSHQLVSLSVLSAATADCGYGDVMPILGSTPNTFSTLLKLNSSNGVPTLFEDVPLLVNGGNRDAFSHSGEMFSGELHTNSVTVIPTFFGGRILKDPKQQHHTTTVPPQFKNTSTTTSSKNNNHGITKFADWGQTRKGHRGTASGSGSSRRSSSSSRSSIIDLKESDSERRHRIVLGLDGYGVDTNDDLPSGNSSTHAALIMALSPTSSSRTVLIPLFQRESSRLPHVGSPTSATSKDVAAEGCTFGAENGVADEVMITVDCKSRLQQINQHQPSITDVNSVASPSILSDLRGNGGRGQSSQDYHQLLQPDIFKPTNNTSSEASDKSSTATIARPRSPYMKSCTDIAAPVSMYSSRATAREKRRQLILSSSSNTLAPNTVSQQQQQHGVSYIPSAAYPREPLIINTTATSASSTSTNRPAADNSGSIRRNNHPKAPPSPVVRSAKSYREKIPKETLIDGTLLPLFDMASLAPDGTLDREAYQHSPVYKAILSQAREFNRLDMTAFSPIGQGGPDVSGADESAGDVSGGDQSPGASLTYRAWMSEATRRAELGHDNYADPAVVLSAPAQTTFWPQAVTPLASDVSSRNPTDVDYMVAGPNSPLGEDYTTYSEQPQQQLSPLAVSIRGLGLDASFVPHSQSQPFASDENVSPFVVDARSGGIAIFSPSTRSVVEDGGSVHSGQLQNSSSQLINGSNSIVTSVYDLSGSLVSDVDENNNDRCDDNDAPAGGGDEQVNYERHLHPPLQSLKRRSSSNSAVVSSSGAGSSAAVGGARSGGGGSNTGGNPLSSKVDSSTAGRGNDQPSPSLGALGGEGSGAAATPRGGGASAASSSAVAGGGGGASAEFSFGIGSEEWFMQMVSLGSTINK